MLYICDRSTPDLNKEDELMNWTIYVFTTSLYLCVIYHYVFIDLYIESRGLATILVLMLLVLQCTDYK